jgi:uncharacterized protein (TIGR03437 family)
VAGEMSNTFVANVTATLSTILAVVHQSDGAPVSAAEPAVAGETLVVYLAGLGAVNTDLSFGTAAPASPPVSTVVTPQVTLEGAPATVVLSGLTPGFVGLYQVTVAVPATLPQGGSANLTVSVPGSTAASVPIALATQ